MIDETPPEASSFSNAAIKLTAAAVFFTLLTAGYLSPRMTHAASFPQAASAKNPLSATERNIALGLDHFDAHCASCHGATRKGDTEKGKSLGAADLTSERTQSKSDAELFRVISRGIPGQGMPAFGKTHQATEIWQTVLFLRKLPALTGEERRKLESAVPEGARHKHSGRKHGTDHQHNDPKSTEHQHDQAGKPSPGKPEPITAQPHQHEMPQTKPPAQGEARPEHQHQAQPGQTPSARPEPRRIAPGEPAPGEHAGHQMPGAPPAQNVPAGPVMTLAEMERMAMQNNPTLAQAEAAIRAAQGRRRQAGLFPNPTVGYQGEEFAFRAFSDKAEHFGFIEQTIPLGGKLRKSRRVFEQEVAQAEIEATAQKQRVLNTVHILYYEALGAQQLVELRTELARIAGDATKTTSELLNVGQADRPDYLESEIETEQAELELEKAKTNLRQVWQLLAAVAGTPTMGQVRLAGNLEEGIPTLDQETLMATLLRESPEIKRARAEVERTQAVLARAKAERIPDLFLRGGVGYSSEFLEGRNGATGRRTGPEANVQVGITLPIFNRNQGGIAAAQAEVTIAERELTRLDLALRVRLAQAFRDYHNALSAVRRYKEIILPRAEKAYTLYLASFRQMAASYPQVLISQRTMFQVREQYLNALVDLRQNAIQIEGFLLTGGLDAPRFRTADAERVEMTGVRSGSRGGANQPENQER